MSSFLRPEAARALRRWREALAGAGVLALGAYWLLATGGLLRLVGGILALLGAGLLFAGLQRGRFRTEASGAGVVQLVEGQLGYFGPETGGVIAVADLSCVARRGDTWVLDGGGQRLEIPAGAAGAECLLDAFAMLPGLDLRAVLSPVEDRTEPLRVLWQRGPRRLG